MWYMWNVDNGVRIDFSKCKRQKRSIIQRATRVMHVKKERGEKQCCQNLNADAGGFNAPDVAVDTPADDVDDFKWYFSCC